MLGVEPELILLPGPEAGLARRLMLRSLEVLGWRLSSCMVSTSWGTLSVVSTHLLGWRLSNMGEAR